MGGWSNSEEEDSFKPRPSDFTPTNIPQEPPAADRADSQVYELPYSTKKPQDFEAPRDYLCERLGFKVGGYFDGEKRLYQQRR